MNKKKEEEEGGKFEWQSCHTAFMDHIISCGYILYGRTKTERDKST